MLSSGRGVVIHHPHRTVSGTDLCQVGVHLRVLSVTRVSVTQVLQGRQKAVRDGTHGTRLDAISAAFPALVQDVELSRLALESSVGSFALCIRVARSKFELTGNSDLTFGCSFRSAPHTKLCFDVEWSPQTRCDGCWPEETTVVEDDGIRTSKSFTQFVTGCASCQQFKLGHLGK